MKILVTGSSGHLGEALMRSLQNGQHDAIGVDIISSPFTHKTGSIVDRRFVADCMRGVDAVIHTATLHKPHVATHTRQDFIDTNISGTLNLLEEAAQQGIRAFVFTSTTSVFGHALTPPPGFPAVWVTEDLKPVPKNIYGATKTAAENLCELIYRDHGLATIVLRTSRFFPEDDDEPAKRQAFDNDNMKINEYLYRRVDIEDAVSAHLQAVERAPEIGFGRYIITATTPFNAGDLVVVAGNTPRACSMFEVTGNTVADTVSIEHGTTAYTNFYSNTSVTPTLNSGVAGTAFPDGGAVGGECEAELQPAWMKTKTAAKTVLMRISVFFPSRP